MVAGRPREFDLGAALDAAMLVFWRKGFLATSVNDLCEAMAIRSPSLYAAFGSKERLYLEAVDHYAKTAAPVVWDHLADGPTVRDGLKNFLLAAARCLSDVKIAPRSCMVTLAGMGDEFPAGIQEAVRKLRLETLETLRSCLRTAVAQGELAESTDVESLSRFYLGVYQGIALQAADGATQSELEKVAETAMAAWPTSPQQFK